MEQKNRRPITYGSWKVKPSCPSALFTEDELYAIRDAIIKENRSRVAKHQQPFPVTEYDIRNGIHLLPAYSNDKWENTPTYAALNQFIQVDDTASLDTVMKILCDLQVGYLEYLQANKHLWNNRGYLPMGYLPISMFPSLAPAEWVSNVNQFIYKNLKDTAPMRPVSFMNTSVKTLNQDLWVPRKSVAEFLGTTEQEASSITFWKWMANNKKWSD